LGALEGGYWKIKGALKFGKMERDRAENIGKRKSNSATLPVF